MERLVVLPFTAGCVSYASVAVSEQQPRRSKPDTNSSTISSLSLFLGFPFSFFFFFVCFVFLFLGLSGLVSDFSFAL